VLHVTAAEASAHSILARTHAHCKLLDAPPASLIKCSGLQSLTADT